MTKKERLKLVKKKFEAERSKRIAKSSPMPKPRYDEVYFQGLEWLDSLAGPSIPIDTIVEAVDKDRKTVYYKVKPLNIKED